MIDNYIHVIKNGFDFDGRASVREYWSFTLLHFIIWIILISVIAFVDLGRVFNLLGYLGYPILVFIPSLAVTFRRLHDTNRSGWWLLLSLVAPLGIIVIVFLILSGNPQTNFYGERPNR